MARALTSSSIAVFFLALLLPLGASASNPCKPLQRDLDRQIDELKARRKMDLQVCERNYGRHSQECSALKDQQKLELASLREERTRKMAACRGPATLYASGPFSPGIDNMDLYYLLSQDNCWPYLLASCYPRPNVRNHRKHRHHHNRHYRHDPETDSRAAKAASATTTSGAGRRAAQGAVTSSGAGRDNRAQLAHRNRDRNRDNSLGRGHGLPSTASSGVNRGGGSYSGGASHPGPSFSSGASHSGSSSGPSYSGSSPGPSHSGAGSGGSASHASGSRRQN